MYKLKDTEPEFTVTDGPFALKQYRHGENYEAIPPDLASCFEEASAGTKAKVTVKPTEEINNEKLYSGL